MKIITSIIIQIFLFTTLCFGAGANSYLSPEISMASEGVKDRISQVSEQDNTASIFPTYDVIKELKKENYISGKIGQHDFAGTVRRRKGFLFIHNVYKPQSKKDIRCWGGVLFKVPYEIIPSEDEDKGVFLKMRIKDVSKNGKFSLTLQWPELKNDSYVRLVYDTDKTGEITINLSKLVKDRGLPAGDQFYVQVLPVGHNAKVEIDEFVLENIPVRQEENAVYNRHIYPIYKEGEYPINLTSYQAEQIRVFLSAIYSISEESKRKDVSKVEIGGELFDLLNQIMEEQESLCLLMELGYEEPLLKILTVLKKKFLRMSNIAVKVEKLKIEMQSNSRMLRVRRLEKEWSYINNQFEEKNAQYTETLRQHRVFGSPHPGSYDEIMSLFEIKNHLFGELNRTKDELFRKVVEYYNHCRNFCKFKRTLKQKMEEINTILNSKEEANIYSNPELLAKEFKKYSSLMGSPSKASRLTAEDKKSVIKMVMSYISSQSDRREENITSVKSIKEISRPALSFVESAI
ncbi:MAG: hypothetical protein GY853_00320 [PVC group bacterium]|nr:hypothetical protein [PVC group bacterium]